MTISVAGPSWLDEAACQHVDPAIFEIYRPSRRTPNGYRLIRARDWNEAREACQGCPVIDQCREAWLNDPRTTGHEEMFVAGMNPDQIRAELKRRQGVR